MLSVRYCYQTDNIISQVMWEEMYFSLQKNQLDDTYVAHHLMWSYLMLSVM